MGYEELLVKVQKLMRDGVSARYRGDLHANKVRAQAYADGYMRALLDAELVGHEELLQVVAEARNDVAGASVEQREQRPAVIERAAG